MNPKQNPDGRKLDSDPTQDPSLEVTGQYLSYLKRNITAFAEAARLTDDEKKAVENAIDEVERGKYKERFGDEYQRHLKKMRDTGLSGLITNRFEALGHWPGMVNAWLHDAQSLQALPEDRRKTIQGTLHVGLLSGDFRRHMNEIWDSEK